MKPILILQHIDSGGPGLFADFLRLRAVPFEIRRPDRGDPVPVGRDLDVFSGIGLCGGTQSANDPLPYIREELQLIRAAAERALPVIGHCLGGQLISKALGGVVRRHTDGEFGWQPLYPVGSHTASAWLRGAPPRPLAMQWHEDSYSNPPGAEPILTGAHCRNQAFVIGKLLGMQFHVELTETQIHSWVEDLAERLPAAGPGVQCAEEVIAQLPQNFPASRALAESLYTHWLEQIQ